MLFYTFVLASPEQLASIVEDRNHKDAYADYVRQFSVFSIAINVSIATTRFLGALTLLMRKSWSVLFFSISLALFGVTLIRGFIFGNAAEVMGPSHIFIEIIMLTLSVFAVVFAIIMKRKGVLT